MNDDLLVSAKATSSDAAMTPVDEFTFQEKVIEASQNRLVIVDFHAEWCGPCQQLTPLLIEAAKEFSSRLTLVSIDIDRNSNLSVQMGIRSVPIVFAFWQGSPLDGFSGLRPKSAIVDFYRRCLEQARPEDAKAEDPAAGGVDAALESLRQGDHAQAAAGFAAVLQERPDDVQALAGLAECYWMAGDVERAKAVIESAPMAEDPALIPWRTRLAMWEKGQRELPKIDQRRRAVEKNPQDDGARISWSLALFADGESQRAMEVLLDGMRAGSARGGTCHQQILEYFTALGEDHPLSAATRRDLAAILFS